MAKDQNDGHGAENIDPWLLEEVYPNAKDIFTAYTPPAVSEDKVIIALDTNALLLPYRMNPGNLEAIGKVYKDLSDKKRLVVPARAVREFAKHRDRKLGELIQALNEQRRRFPSDQLPPLVQDVEGYNEAAKCLADLRPVKDAYDKAIGKIIAGMKEWRGNDPVASLYAGVFPSDAIIDLSISDTADRERLLKEARRRTTNRIPPGYQDASKDDEGIGDFLIWKSLLKLAAERKQDLAFVTGEQKNDWFVRSGGEHIYPRFELVDEYRRASDGRSLRLMSLPQLLNALNAPASVVDDAKTAEAQSAEAERAAERQLVWTVLKKLRSHDKDFLASFSSSADQPIPREKAWDLFLQSQIKPPVDFASLLAAQRAKLELDKAKALSSEVEEEEEEEEDGESDNR